MSVVTVPERMRISADRFEKMIDTGVLTKYDPVELIEGDMITMAPINPPHYAGVARLMKLFVLAAGDEAIVLPGGPVRLGDYSMPQPDLMVLKPREDFYSGKRPVPSDILLLVEVADSSLHFDQGVKRALYARHGVVEYWVVDIPHRCVHVYREPTPEGYATRLDCERTDVASPRGLPAIQLVVGTLFP
jgi:Uma2 family endonuclease